MHVITPDNFIPYEVLFMPIEPEDDLTIKFYLQLPTPDEISPINCNNIKLVNCKTTLILRDDLQDAILYWLGCENKQYDLENADVVVNDDNEIVSIAFTVDYADLSNANTFRLSVVAYEEPKIIARGRVYIEL